MSVCMQHKGQQQTERHTAKQTGRRTVAVARLCLTIVGQLKQLDWCWYCETDCFLGNVVATAGQLSATAATMRQPKHFEASTNGAQCTGRQT